MMYLKKVILAVIAVALFACKKESVSLQSISNSNATNNSVAFASAVVIAADYPVIMHKAAPKQTDPAITRGTETQFAYLPQSAANRKDRLMIFIPGTFSAPSNYDEVCQAAAHHGYYAFAVAYSNSTPIEFQIGNNPNNSTTKNVLNEYLTGENSSPKVNVSRANSFENRIIKMISYIDSLYPAENWKRFLTADKQIIWTKLSVGGHSQGSDHAMYWSKVRPLLRAGFIGGPGSFQLQDGSYPTFMQQPGATPYDSLYGFNHTNDDVRPWADVKNVWAVLGVPGTPNSVDDGLFSNTHRLFSSMPGIDAHSGTIADDVTPIDSATGKPVFQPVWQYMLFP